MKLLSFSLILTTLSLGLNHVTHAESDYQRWLKSTQQDFQSYLDKNDRAFTQFLKQRWETVELDTTGPRDPEPKPSDMPVAPPEDTKKPLPDTADASSVITIPRASPDTDTKPGLGSNPPDNIPPDSDQPVDQTPVSPKPAPSVPTPVRGLTLSVDFYGHSLNIPYAKNLKRRFSGKPGGDAIASYWESQAKGDYQPTLTYLLDTAKQLGLNDWATTVLFNQLAAKLHPDQNSQALTSWFLLVKAGYNARIAYDNQIYLLMPSQDQLYNTTYFTLNGTPFYAVGLNRYEPSGKKVFTYDGQHELGRKTLSFNTPNRFVPGGAMRSRTLSFDYEQQIYKVNLEYPQGYRDYFNSYPQLELTHYFQAGLPANVAASLLQQLKPLVSGQSELEAVNRLLRFVQTAFQYQTDQQQFQAENYLFPMETLIYPYSDCEDRAALFAWLVKQLTGLESRIMGYPGHIAVAVHFSSSVPGDQWRDGTKTFVMADPTYINARVGMTMPAYKGQTPSMRAF